MGLAMLFCSQKKSRGRKREKLPIHAENPRDMPFGLGKFLYSRE